MKARNKKTRLCKALPALVVTGCLLLTKLCAERLWAKAPYPDSRGALAQVFTTRLAKADYTGLRTLIAKRSIEQLGEAGARQLLVELHTGVPSSTSSAKASRPPLVVVCIQENTQWRVDLIETATRFFKLTAAQKRLMITGLRGLDEASSTSGQGGATTMDCQSNLKQLALAMQQYVQDYDELFPPADKWCGAIQPYLKDESTLHCPGAGKNRYGYAMNMRLSGQNEASLTYIDKTVLLYDSKSLRRNAFGAGGDVASRHAGGANYAYANGRVKWHRSSELQNFRLDFSPPRSGVPHLGMSAKTKAVSPPFVAAPRLGVTVVVPPPRPVAAEGY